MNRRDLIDDATATVALAAYSVAVAAGFARVFSGWAFLYDLAIIAIAGHAISFVFRRLRLTGWIAIPLVAAALVWLISLQRYRPTLRFGLPSRETWAQFSDEVGLVRDQFPTAVAPVVYGAGWAALAAIAIGITVLLADTFAFRASARAEALVPGGVLFVFISALASPRLRVAVTVGVVATGVLAVAALRRLHADRQRVVLRPSGAPIGLGALAAVALAVAVALLAGIVGPRLPTAGAEPLYETRGRGGGTASFTSPLVDIRSRLTNRGSVELFRVNADTPSYWRSTTLPEFDGQTFTLPNRPLEDVGATGTTDGDRSIRQRIQILSLGGRLIPAAADPLQADGESSGATLDLRINRDTSTLLAPDDLQPGDVFNVVSTAPSPTPDRLRAASTTAPDEVFLGLPDDLPDVVAETAAQVTAGAPTAYDAAIALQQYFRQFEYSLEVQSGHSGSAIETFLRLRSGYCEQFSATFAAMARTLGIPSRVAVGYTQGTLGSDGFYSVIGKNAHAWPELWFDGIGWVPFEPTPGRGAPGAEAFTGVPAEQDDSGPDAPPEGSAAGAPLPTTPPSAVPPTFFDFESQNIPDFGELPEPGGVPFGADDVAGESSSSPAFRLIVMLLALVALAAVAPWIARRIVRRVRRPDDPADRVVESWVRARRAVERAGVPGSTSSTPTEWVAATADRLPAANRHLQHLADAVEIAVFAPDGTSTDSDVGERCEEWADQVERVATDTMPTNKRVAHHFTTWS